MSLQIFLSTIGTDVETGLKKAGAAIENGVVVLEQKTEAALEFLWSEAKPILVGAEPTIIQGVLTEMVSFLQTAEQDIVGGSSEDIETAFLNTLEATGHALAADAKNLGSTLLQVLIGLAKGKLAA